MIIKNGNVFCPDAQFRVRDVFINRSGAFSDEPEPNDTEVIDAEGMYVIPGLVDIHSHGDVSHDFCDADAEGLAATAEYKFQNGITAFCPTSMTYPEERLEKIFATADGVPEDGSHAFVAGINMEGPFISPHKVGAQNPKYVMPADTGMFERLMNVSKKPIALMTIAPEEAGAMDFIRKFADRTHISLGHSVSGYDTAKEAFANGADHITHMYNAMPMFAHRDPGIIGAASDTPGVFCELIADGVHSHPSAVRNAFRMMGADRMVLISDSMRATGLPDGESELGGQKVIKNGAEARLENGALAGSVSNLMECMRRAISFGIRPEDAIRAATMNPAESIGMGGQLGVIAAGARGNAVFLDKDFNLVQVL